MPLELHYILSYFRTYALLVVECQYLFLVGCQLQMLLLGCIEQLSLAGCQLRILLLGCTEWLQM